MERNNDREYQTVRLFATLAALTVLIVLLFKVVLFGPQAGERVRLPAIVSEQSLQVQPSPQPTPPISAPVKK